MRRNARVEIYKHNRDFINSTGYTLKFFIPYIIDINAKIRTETDFYTAPASTNYHLSVEGGLLQHSLNVYNCLYLKTYSPVWGRTLKDVSDETLIIVSLLHDLCKTNFYTECMKNTKTYDQEKVAKAERWKVKHDNKGDFIWESVPGYMVEDSLPLGHDEKSVILADRFIKLTTAEILAIRWHMGYSEEKATYASLGKAMDCSCLVTALHEADMEASKLCETKDENSSLGEILNQRCLQYQWEDAKIKAYSDDDECPFN